MTRVSSSGSYIRFGGLMTRVSSSGSYIRSLECMLGRAIRFPKDHRRPELRPGVPKYDGTPSGLRGLGLQGLKGTS